MKNPLYHMTVEELEEALELKRQINQLEFETQKLLNTAQERQENEEATGGSVASFSGYPKGGNQGPAGSAYLTPGKGGSKGRPWSPGRRRKFQAQRAAAGQMA